MTIRTPLTLGVVVVGLVIASTCGHGHLSAAANAGVGPELESTGPITFGPDGTLFVADNRAAAIYALDLATHGSGTLPGTEDVSAVDQKIAALLGTDAREIRIADLAVNPVSRNAFVSVSRGRGAGAQPVLVRIDGAGHLEVIALGDVEYTMVELPNPPDAAPSADGDRPVPRRDGSWLANGRVRMQTVTDMAYVDGQLFIAGLSNDEFSSKLRAVAYPFVEAGAGASVEIWHAAHG